jgi:hypothetical protein
MARSDSTTRLRREFLGFTGAVGKVSLSLLLVLLRLKALLRTLISDLLSVLALTRGFDKPLLARLLSG